MKNIRGKKREYILNIAQSIFSYFGLKKTTIDEIAQKAGIGKGTIYNYFKSKEELFTKVVKREKEELKENILETIRNIKEPEKQLIAFFTTKITYLYKLKNFYSIKRDMLDVIYEELDKIIKSYYNFEKRTLLHILRNGIKKGDFKINNLQLTVNVIMLTSKSLELYWLRNPEYKTPEQPIKEIKNLITILFDGIKKR